LTVAVVLLWFLGTKNGAVPHAASVKSIVVFVTVSGGPS
jgi:hypothetical protein